MSKLRTGRPLWLDRRPSSFKSTRPPRFSRYRGSLSVDVVIVGGGITGAIAAYTFADSGLAVALLEARRIGHGSTAASTALLMREPDKDFVSLRTGTDRWRRAASGRPLDVLQRIWSLSSDD
jgi:glycine/D-amino acid oxidase-like deaminating enzyme